MNYYFSFWYVILLLIRCFCLWWVYDPIRCYILSRTQSLVYVVSWWADGLRLLYDCRMEMKYSFGSKRTLNWRSWWMHIVIDNLWTWIPLPSYSMGAGSEQNRLLMRFASFIPAVSWCQEIYVSMYHNPTCFLCISSARNGGWGRDRCNVAPNWWSPVNLNLWICSLLVLVKNLIH